MKKIYVHENGEPLTTDELALLKNNSTKAATDKVQQAGQPNFVKIWLLILLTIVVLSGIVFAVIEYQQSQQIIDTGSKWLNNR